MNARPNGYMNTLPQKAARQEYIDKQGSRGSEQNLARKVQVSGMNFCVHRIVSDRRVRLRSMHACLKVLPPSTNLHHTAAFTVWRRMCSELEKKLSARENSFKENTTLRYACGVTSMFEG
jgi:hypothetical protein